MTEMISQELAEKVRAHYNAEEVSLFERACAYATRAHDQQLRESGEPYIVHPFGVAEILVDLGLDMDTVVAGILHDVVEDTAITSEEITKEFGPEVEYLVTGVTKLSKLQFHSKEEQQAENLRKMFLAMAKDIRVILIKLADRLHNMRTLKYREQAKQISVAKETMEIYAPLANRLGIFSLKTELEDLSFKYLHSDEYSAMARSIELTKAQRQQFVREMIDMLNEKLREGGIKAEISGRSKHFFSIYKKMTSQQKTLDQIYDVFAIRVIVDSIKDCYGVLGIVHTIWRPLPGRFKDYIAMPKPNMYQSLHTTVFAANSMPFEIQIRTREMHQTAEFGIAAHWKYKEGVKEENTSFENKLSWLRRIMEWQSDLKDSKEFMEGLKIDIFSDEVFVFTPKGDVINLPTGSTPLDFAYGIHSAIGHKCIGAKVNGRIVPLGSILKSGDIVEIITTSAQHGPSRDWLKIVKTSQAKNKIRQWFKKEMREENIEKGREMLEYEAKRLGLQLPQLMKSEWLEPIFDKYSLSSVEDLYASIGYGGLSMGQIVPKLADEYRRSNRIEKPEVEPTAKNKNKATVTTGGVKVKGESNMLVRFARCCNPVPGDHIIGYITRGRGVSIHRVDCVNISGLENEREIEVSWESAGSTSYNAEIQVTAYDQIGLFMTLTNLLAEKNVNIIAVNAHTNKNGIAVINMTIEITDTEQLTKIQTQLRKLSSVIDVARVFS